MDSKIYLAGGCFWGLQKFLDQFDGIKSTTTGYANGTTSNPTYKEVCSHTTGHTETVEVIYAASQISTEQLLRYYFMVIDPLSVNKQGGDEGPNYRTGIYYTDPAMLPAIQTVCDEVVKKVGKPLAVEVMPLQNFYPAEEYHQKYLDKNPGGYCHIKQEMLRYKELQATLGKN